MELYPKKPFEDDEKPDKTGEKSTSKKKKKTPRGILPPLEAEKSKKADQKKDELKKPEATPDKELEKISEKTAEEAEQAEPELELPEVVSADEAPFMGELVIDHSDEVAEGEAESIPTDPTDDGPVPELMERAVSEAPAVDAMSAEPAPASDEVLQDAAEQQSESAPSARPRFAGFMPENISRGAMVNPSERVLLNEAPLPSPEAQMPAAEVRRSVRRAERRGLSRGVTSGVLAGWWAGRRNLRNRFERQQAAVAERQDQAVAQLQKEYGELTDAIRQQESLLQKTDKQLRSFVERTWDTEILKRRDEAPAEVSRPAPTTPLSGERTHFNRQEAPSSAGKEAVPAVEHKSQPEAIPIEHQPITEEMYKAPEGHRFETSAWHRVEVDERTGRAVEAPSFTYGEAFQHEQQQERLAREASQAQTAAQVAMTLASTTPQAQPAKTAEPPVAPSAAPAKQPVFTAADITFAKQQFVQQATSPATWAIAIFILIFLVATGII